MKAFGQRDRGIQLNTKGEERPISDIGFGRRGSYAVKQ